VLSNPRFGVLKQIRKDMLHPLLMFCGL